MVHQQRPDYYQSRDHQVRERHRQQEFPAEGHQLVVAEARQRGARPDVEEHDEADFQQKPERPLNDGEHHGMQAGESDYQSAGGDDDQLDARDAAREDYGVIGK